MGGGPRGSPGVLQAPASGEEGRPAPVATAAGSPPWRAPGPGAWFPRAGWWRWCVEGLRDGGEFRDPVRRWARNVVRVPCRRLARPSRPRRLGVRVVGACPLGSTTGVVGRGGRAAALVLGEPMLRRAVEAAGYPPPRSRRLRAECIRDFGVHTEGLYRVSWAAPEPRCAPATIVLKRLRPRGDGTPMEVAAYTSGVLATLPDGLRAPRYLGHVDRGPGGWDLWLEDLGRAMRRARWTAARYAAAAHALGRMNAQWFAAPPSLDWVRPGFLEDHARRWLAREQWGSHVLVGGRLWRRMVRCLEGLDAQLAAFGALPMGLAHQDASPRNLLVEEEGRRARIALLDWELCGLAPLGQEIVPLVWSGWQACRADELEAREAVVWDAYLRGLQDVGLQRRGLAFSTRVLSDLRFAYGLGVSVLYLPEIAASGEPRLVDLALQRWEAAEVGPQTR